MTAVGRERLRSQVLRVSPRGSKARCPLASPSLGTHGVCELVARTPRSARIRHLKRSLVVLKARVRYGSG